MDHIVDMLDRVYMLDCKHLDHYNHNKNILMFINMPKEELQKILDSFYKYIEKW